MGVYDKIGKIVVFIFAIILIIGVLAYFGFIAPEATEKPLRGRCKINCPISTNCIIPFGISFMFLNINFLKFFI